MSFNSRFPSEHHRRWHYGNGPRFPQAAAAKAEDAQPNELLSKRNLAGPPVIRTSVPIPRNCGRGTYTGRGAPASLRGRGGLHTAAPIPRTGRGTDGHYNQPGIAVPGSSTRPGTQVGGRDVQANPFRHTIPASRPPDVPPQQRDFSNYSRATHRAERSNDENPSATENGAFPIAFGSVSAALNQKHALDAASASNLPPDFSKRRDNHRPAIPPRPQPPIPRRQTLFANLREPPPPPPPHLSGLGNASISGPEVRNSEQAHSAASRPAMDNVSSAGSSRASSSDGTPLSLRTHPKPTNATKTLASASDLLLNDLNKPSTSTETSRGHLPPPAKRRKLSPPAIPRTRPLSPPLPPPRVKTLEVLAPPNAPAPASTTPSLNVKRERSPSPVIGTDSVPQLITEGCVRIAPLPPECKNTRPGHKEARKMWTTREVTRLRGLGVQPMRIFVREDGMVIDWKSKVPVMSDTLRPPPTSASPAKAAPVSSGPSSPPTKKQKLQATSTGETASREHEGDGRAREHGTAPPTRRPAHSTSWGEIPAPGETIWRRVLPSPRASVAEVGEDVRRDAVPSSYARSGCPSPAVGPSTGVQPAGDIVDLTDTGDNAEVEIIDLTDEPDIQPEDSSPPHAVAQTELSTSLSADGDEMEAAALRFLQRYVTDFATDRAALARAYSRAATFSTQTLPPLHPYIGTAAPGTSPARHHGRFEIIAALLDLPDDEAPLVARKVDWDFVYAREAGDVLLVCYTAARVQEQATAHGKGKQKEKALAKLLDGLCEQRFILRPKEWDEEDRATPGVWPLVAVAHQMLFRPLPP